VSERTAIRDAEVDGRRVDVVLLDGRIAEVVGAGRSTADQVIDAAGGALIPGLHDHHTHLLASAAARSSTSCGPPAVADRRALAISLAAADAALPAGTWLRGVGYHESVAGELDRFGLDAFVPRRPCRVQHRSGHAWILNSAGLAAIGIEAGDDLPAGVEVEASGAPTGRIYGLDGWLRSRVPGIAPDLQAIGDQLARYGVTAVTDATPAATAAELRPIIAAVRSGALRQRVVVTGSPALPVDAVDGIETGPAKIVLVDHRLPGVDEVVDDFRLARAEGRRVAVHCVTRAALILALAAWNEIGAAAGDRIEHAAVVPDELVGEIARLGLTVVTQPRFVADRGDDYAADVDADDRPYLWRCASLIAAGVAVGFGTDAPFGDADPWRVIDAAVHRRTHSGAILGAAERLPPRAALDRLLTPLDDPGGAPRRVATGAPADLCLLDLPLDAALANPSAEHVRLTLRAGQQLTR
jgi:predicted amidohydrolase YtcJ